MRARRGFALAELLVSILLIAIVGGAVADGLRRQQQVFRSIALMVSTRGDARDAAEVLAADLASASPLDTLTLAADSAIEFFSLIGASISCDSAPGYAVPLPPEKLWSGHRLTTLLAAPDSGDVLIVFNADSAATAGAPRWERHAIASVSSVSAASACPSARGFTTVEDQSAPAYVLTLAGPVSDGISRGDPVRVLRRIRYSLYRASDSRWYLGQRRCGSVGPPACGAIQPVSGPYMAYAATGPSGITLRYLDAGSVPLFPPGGSSRVALVDVTARARTFSPIQLRGPAPAWYLDSTAVSIALRNRD